MKNYKFSIIRNKKKIHETTVQAPNYNEAHKSYIAILKECEIKKQPFDMLLSEIN